MALFFYKEKNKDIRAAAYLRLSIEDGDKAESNSIGNQRELIRDFAAERPGLHLVEEYADDGYTGTNFERPGFKRMMEDIKSGKINCIIVKDLSRLGRNYIEMGKYLEQIFPMMGIRFIAINDNYDNANSESSDSDSIVVPFKNLLNDSYCRDISIKVRSQLDMKRRKGEFIGGYAIYGYCKDKRNKNRLVVDEYAADIVRSIYRRKLEGMSAQAIAEQLNSENVLAPSEYKRLCGLNYHSGFKAGTHAKWQAIQVLRILKNEVYTGTMVQGRRQKINYKIKKNSGCGRIRLDQSSQYARSNHSAKAVRYRAGGLETGHLCIERTAGCQSLFGHRSLRWLWAEHGAAHGVEKREEIYLSALRHKPQRSGLFLASYQRK